LAEHIRTHTPYDGDFENQVLPCRFGRFSKGGRVCVKTFSPSAVLLVAQGSKEMTIGKEVCHLGTAQILLLPLALPVGIHTVQASATKPFLSVGITGTWGRMNRFTRFFTLLR
jgi:hypothetical protein